MNIKIPGEGSMLQDGCPWLQNEEERIERILDVVERNSVIEGLPRFDEETRQRLKERLKDGSVRAIAS